MEDLQLVNYGTVGLVHPKTHAGRIWLRETAPEEAQFMGSALAFEPRYYAGIVEAAEAEGLVVRL